MTDERGTDLVRGTLNYNDMTGDPVEDAIRKLCLMMKLTRMTPSPTLDQINEFMVVAEKDIRSSFAALEPYIHEREQAAKREVLGKLQTLYYDSLVLDVPKIVRVLRDEIVFQIAELAPLDAATADTAATTGVY